MTIAIRCCLPSSCARTDVGGEADTATHGEQTPAGHTEGTRAILIGTNKELNTPGNPRDMIVSAEKRFPVGSGSVFRPVGSVSAMPK
jgi:hypothetical protein